MAKSSSKTTKKRKVNVEAVGQAHVTASFNNIIISLTNKNGDVISWSSAGKMGFRGSKKNTPYAAQLAAEDGIRDYYASRGLGDVYKRQTYTFTLRKPAS